MKLHHSILLPLLFTINYAFAQEQDTATPQTIHIQRGAQGHPFLPALDTLNNTSNTGITVKDTITCIPMVSHATSNSGMIKLTRAEILNAGAITLRGGYNFRIGPSQTIKWSVNGSHIAGGIWPRDAQRGNCDYIVVSYKMKFARRIVNYQLKKVVKVDGNKTYLVANDANFTDEMMNVIEAVPRGEKILIYNIRVKRKDGEVKKLPRITIKVMS